ncbi:MAG: RagB/SusD protein, partial [Adhaeribacter sp.]|nr:RagB/SusD protein [Adhaeribacter sp.]
MKRIFNRTLILTLLLLVQLSCKKEWLEPKPLSFFAPENVYVDEAGFR